MQRQLREALHETRLRGATTDSTAAEGYFHVWILAPSEWRVYHFSTDMRVLESLYFHAWSDLQTALTAWGVPTEEFIWMPIRDDR